MNRKVIIVLCSVLLSLSACKEEKELKYIVTDLSEKKANIEGVIGHTPYNQSEHEIISSYFRAFLKYSERLEILIKKGTKKKKDILSFREKFPNFCEDTVLSLSQWNEINQKCLVGNYFLCAEEARVYPRIAKKLILIGSELLGENSNGERCVEWKTFDEGEENEST